MIKLLHIAFWFAVAVMAALVLLAEGCAVWEAAGVPVHKMNVVEKAAFFAGPGH